MGVWSGTNISNVFAGTPTSAFLAIYDPATQRTWHPLMPPFAVSNGALPQLQGRGHFVLDDGEEVAAHSEGRLRVSVWGNYEGAAKPSTIRSGNTTSSDAYTDVWTARSALITFTTTRVAWVAFPAIEHPLAHREKRFRRLIERESPAALAAGHVRFDWTKRISFGTNRQGHPFALIDALDHCQVDSPRPVRIVAWLDGADHASVHALGRSWSAHIDTDVSEWIADWSELDEPGKSLKLVNRNASAP